MFVSIVIVVFTCFSFVIIVFTCVSVVIVVRVYMCQCCDCSACLHVCQFCGGGRLHVHVYLPFCDVEMWCLYAHMSCFWLLCALRFVLWLCHTFVLFCECGVCVHFSTLHNICPFIISLLCLNVFVLLWTWCLNAQFHDLCLHESVY